MDKKLHIKYIKRCQFLLPEPYTDQDLNQMALANFTLSSLDLLDSLPAVSEALEHIEWIYGHLLPCGRGFRGSLHAFVPSAKASLYDRPHLPSTYFAIISLLILGDDLSRLNTSAILTELRATQNPDGSFPSSAGAVDVDVRLVYMAIAVRYIVRRKTTMLDFPDISMDGAYQFIKTCRNHDGGYGQSCHAESHSGLTFCACAALTLLGHPLTGSERVDTISWTTARHNDSDGGFNGRIGKDSDVCYCFWNVSCLVLLDAAHLVDADAVKNYLQECQTIIGGYGKTVGDMPDLYHSYLGISVQHLLSSKSTDAISCALSVTERVSSCLG